MCFMQTQNLPPATHTFNCEHFFFQYHGDAECDSIQLGYASWKNLEYRGYIRVENSLCVD